ncbi:MAG: M28 family metallopeptidase [Anaerolineae bacterium]|jgi:hypothetical protein|nr:Zn-dependent exopeptidase M28 [Chloroflexota bacterium]
MDPTRALLSQVSRDRLDRWLRYLTLDPLHCRQVNYARPGQDKSTLAEADAYIASELEAMGYTVAWEPHQAQAFRCDMSKPVAHRYSRPMPEDPWYTLHDLVIRRPAQDPNAELLIVVAHKDSQSWLQCAPAAYDNGTGTVALMELANLLTQYENQRELMMIFCNEEHWPWTSVAKAQQIAASGRAVAAVLNLDAVGVRSPEDVAAGRYTVVTRFSADAGRELADLMAELVGRYDIGLAHGIRRAERPNDDDGSYIRAGIEKAILMMGMLPYPDPHYHTYEDAYEYVDLTGVCRSVKLALSFVLHVDRNGAP